MNPRDGGPAFPQTKVPCGIGSHPTSCSCDQTPGMSLRAYLAAHAPPMPGWVAETYRLSLEMNEPEAVNLPWNEFCLKKLARREARWRAIYADEQLAELARVVVGGDPSATIKHPAPPREPGDLPEVSS